MEWLALAIAVVLGTALGWILAAARVRTEAQEKIQRAEIAAARSASEADSERVRRAAVEAERAVLSERLHDADSKLAEMTVRAEEMRLRLEEEKRMLAEAQSTLADTFKSLAADTLRQSTGDLLRLAEEKIKAAHEVSARDFEARRKSIEEMVRPAADSLARLDQEIRRIEKERSGAHSQLSEQLRTLGAQTGRLLDALKTPAVRGRWGEVQLRRVVEIAGMVEHCDFLEQQAQSGEAGRLRPDLTVQLPGGKNIVVDSKVPLKAYLEALEQSDESARAARLAEHAAQVRSHIVQLSSKAYWDACRPSPEFVVLFLPGEMFFSAALQQDSALIEDAAARKVILATPTTLIALLKAVSYGWREARLADNAQRISALGQELHERIATMAAHFARLGQSLGKAVEEFNNTARSMESRVLVTARRFNEMGVASRKEIEPLDAVEVAPRTLVLAANGDPDRG